jgi:long-chain acyl-CoA synthetase
MEPIRTIGGLARHQAKARPARTAIVFGEERISYGELDRRASQVANGLLAAGLKPGARIAVLDKNHPSFFELLFGAAKVRAVLVPVNYRLAAPEIAFVLEDAKAEMLFYGPDFTTLVSGIRAALPTIRHFIPVAGDSPDAYGAWRDRQSAKDPELPDQVEDVALQMYTSGTTGRPKGAQLTNRNLLCLLPIFVQEVGRWREEDISLVVMPLFHIGGSGYALTALYLGATDILLREVDPKAILAAIAFHRVTRIFFVPAVLLFLLNTPGCLETDFSSLKMIVYGASPIPLELLKRALKVFRCGFAQVYGLTETTGAITYLAPEEHDPDGTEKMKSCGRAFPDVEFRILDGAGRELPAGEVGEVVCRTPQVMKGYWNQPEANRRSIRDGWFYSGDAGYMDKEGYLYIYDRVKDMIVSGGENIYPAEVESALYGHPAIADVAVIGVPDETWGESVKACVVLKPGTKANPEEIIAFARERIGGFKLPRSIDFMTELPRNPSGKLLKRVLRQPYWEGQERQVH